MSGIEAYLLKLGNIILTSQIVKYLSYSVFVCYETSNVLSVQQGAAISSQLFLVHVYVKDIVEYFLSVTIIFADDSSLVASSKSIHYT